MSIAHWDQPAMWMLLLDSCSTLNLISNKELLHDIHKVPTGVRVQCNAGSITTNLKAYLGDFPVPVWYHPGGIVNILSFHIVARHYHIQYDNSKRDAFFVTGPNGVKVGFETTAEGLYACNTASGNAVTEVWAFINLANDCKQEYTKCEYCDAVLARKVQDIIMFPGDRSYNKIVDANLLANCPVKGGDIQAPGCLFGKNINVLKGKTAYKQGVPVTGKTGGVPPSIRD